MADKVDQEAEALHTYLSIRGINDGEIGRALARMKAAGRQQGLREAAEVALGHRVMRERLFSENEASINAHKAMQAQEIEEAITALIEGEGK